MEDRQSLDDDNDPVQPNAMDMDVDLRLYLNPPQVSQNIESLSCDEVWFDLIRKQAIAPTLAMTTAPMKRVRVCPLGGGLSHYENKTCDQEQAQTASYGDARPLAVKRSIIGTNPTTANFEPFTDQDPVITSETQLASDITSLDVRLVRKSSKDIVFWTMMPAMNR